MTPNSETKCNSDFLGSIFRLSEVIFLIAHSSILQNLLNTIHYPLSTPKLLLLDRNNGIS